MESLGLVDGLLVNYFVSSIFLYTNCREEPISLCCCIKLIMLKWSRIEPELLRRARSIARKPYSRHTNILDGEIHVGMTWCQLRCNCKDKIFKGLNRLVSICNMICGNRMPTKEHEEFKEPHCITCILPLKCNDSSLYCYFQYLCSHTSENVCM